jgi:hypothetical protein
VSDNWLWAGRGGGGHHTVWLHRNFHIADFDFLRWTIPVNKMIAHLLMCNSLDLRIHACMISYMARYMPAWYLTCLHGILHTCIHSCTCLLKFLLVYIYCTVYTYNGSRVKQGQSGNRLSWGPTMRYIRFKIEYIGKIEIIFAQQ